MTWRLADREGNLFGMRLWADFWVSEQPQKDPKDSLCLEEESKPGMPVEKAQEGQQQGKQQGSSFYAQELGRLRELGFCNLPLNLYLLKQNKGDVCAVVDWIQQKVDMINLDKAQEEPTKESGAMEESKLPLDLA